MKSALLRLREYRDSISPTERTIADYLLDHPESAMECGVHELAERTFSSASTIIRMCRRIGFDGYKDFRRAVTYEAALRRHNEEERKEITFSDSMEEIIEKITEKNIVSLEDTRNLLDPKSLERCVEIICRSRNVLLFGLGASLLAARDLYLKFLRLNKACVINEDWHAQLLTARNATGEDVGLVFSYSGETEEVLTCMQALKDNRTPVIAITRFSASPVAELADHNIYIAANESIFRSGAMSSRLSQLNVVDILYTAFANRDYEASLSQLSRTHIYKSNGRRQPGE